MRRLVPALLLCVLASGARAQPGVWTATPRPENAAHAFYTTYFYNGQKGLVGGSTSGQTAAKLFRTTDGGTTWSSITTTGATTAINDIFVLNGGERGFIVGDDNYFAVTVDSGRTWTNRTIGLPTWASLTDVQAVYFADSQRGWVVGRVADGNGPRMARTTDGGLTWAAITMTGAANNFHDIDFFDQDNGLAVGTGRPTRKSRSSDAGATWEPNADMGNIDPLTESVSMYGLDALEGTPTAFAAGGKNFGSPIYPVVRRTTDHGATWTNLISNIAPVAILPKPASDIIALGPQVLYVAAQDAKIIRSTDGGATWTAEIVTPVAGTTPDLRKFSLTPDNYLWVVGSSGNVLRTRLVPDATFTPASPIPFGTLCPGESASQTLTVGNTGLGVLNVIGASIIQPPGGTVQFAIVLPAVARVWPRQQATQRMTVTVAPGTPGGTHVGEIRLSTNDENGAGTDAFKTIQLSVVVPDNGVGIDSAVSRDAGRVSVGAMRSMALTGLLRNISSICKAPIDTVYLVRGLDFRLVPPMVGRDTLRPLDRRDVFLEFSPSRVCERYDTLVVRQSGGQVSLRIPIVGTGTEATYATSPVDTLRFGSVQIGATGTATLRLLNRRPGSCLDRTALRSLTITGPNASEFATSVTVTPGLSFIPADGEIAVPFTATPSALGPRIAYAVIEHELSATPDVVVLIVNGTDAELTTTTEEIVFPVTGVGMRRDTTVVAALRNLGVTAVTITNAIVTGTDATAFILSSPIAPRTIARGASDSIVLAFVPNRVGMFSATLELRSDRGTTFSIRLVGEGAEAAGVLGLDPIVFAATPIGGCREELVERFIVNTGRVPIVVRGIALTSHPRGVAADPSRFTIVSPVIPPEPTIAPGDSLAVLLRFCPTRLGEHVASLVVTTNIPGGPMTDTLIGEGIRARIVASDSIVFPPTRLGTQRDSTIDPFIINLATVALDVTSVSLVGGDSSDFAIDIATPPMSVAAGLTMPATLRFTPGARGVRSTTLRIESSQGTHDVVVSGRGIYPLLAVTGETTPRTRVGRTLAVDYTITNVGDDGGRVDMVALTGSPAFVLGAVTVPTTLAPGASMTVSLAFTPQTICEHPAQLRVTGEGATELALVGDTSIAITGIGTLPRVFARRDTVDFGSVPVNAVGDTTLLEFIANVSITDPSLLCIDSVSIEAMTISGADASSFAILAPVDARTTLQAGGTLTLTLRFRPTRPGPHTAELSIAFDGVPDSLLRVTLVGNADAPPPVGVGLSFGADHDARPGERIRVPITLGGQVAAGGIDSLVVDVAYHRSLLRLERVVPIGSTTTSTGAPVFGPEYAEVELTLAAPDGLPAGAVAELEFTVLLGRVLAADVFSDSALAPSRPEVVVTSDSATVSIEDFCDANGRLIGFGGALAVKASPNPASDVLTIEYVLPANASTTLAIYDALGRSVLTIVDGVLDPGSYAVTIDTRDLAAGNYYCLLTSGRFERSAVIRLEK